MENTGFIPVFFAVILYGVLHSLVASNQAKALARRFFGHTAQKFYRLFFVIFAVLSFIPILLMIGLLPDRVLYQIPVPLAYITLFIQIFAITGAAYALYQTNLFHFLGFKQIIVSEIQEYESLIIKGPYRYVRHPIYFFSLILIWLAPVMSCNILAFNISATLYMTIGAIIEERKLVLAFGRSYIDYQKNTPMLLPLPKRKK